MFLFQQLEFSLVLSMQDRVWLFKECHKVLMYWVWYLFGPEEDSNWHPNLQEPGKHIEISLFFCSLGFLDTYSTKSRGSVWSWGSRGSGITRDTRLTISATGARSSLRHRGRENETY